MHSRRLWSSRSVSNVALAVSAEPLQDGVDIRRLVNSVLSKQQGHHPTMSLPWQEAVVTKLQQRDARIPRDLPRVSSAARQGSAPVKVDLSEVLEPRQLELTNVEDVSTILSKLATGEWTALETIRVEFDAELVAFWAPRSRPQPQAFCIRALAAHDLTNCLTEVFFDKALERAAMLDRILQTTGKVVGPLQ